MTEVDGPSKLVERIVTLFPAFASEIEGEDIETYHKVIRLLAPVVGGYLKASPKRTTKEFCDLVNAMADAGGETENAISTCLLEHASQIEIRAFISPHLNAAAKRELR